MTGFLPRDLQAEQAPHPEAGVTEWLFLPNYSSCPLPPAIQEKGSVTQWHSILPRDSKALALPCTPCPTFMPSTHTPGGGGSSCIPPMTDNSRQFIFIYLTLPTYKLLSSLSNITLETCSGNSGGSGLSVSLLWKRNKTSRLPGVCGGEASPALTCLSLSIFHGMAWRISLSSSMCMSHYWHCDHYSLLMTMVFVSE